MAKFQFLGGGVKTENTQSAKKWLNFNLGGGGRAPNLKILKVPRNGLISIFFWGGEDTLPSQSQNSKCQDLPKFQFFWGGRGGSVLRVGHSQNFEPNFQPLQLATASQIVSHILRMWRLITISKGIHVTDSYFWRNNQTNVIVILFLNLSFIVGQMHHTKHLI